MTDHPGATLEVEHKDLGVSLFVLAQEEDVSSSKMRRKEVFPKKEVPNTEEASGVKDVVGISSGSLYPRLAQALSVLFP